MKSSNLTLVLSAPSGAGKSTIIGELMRRRTDLDFSISTTTRSIRVGETEGVNYYYVTEDDFRKRIENNEFIEWAVVHGNYYGTLKKEIDRIHLENRIPVLDIDVQGAKIVRSGLENGIFIFILPPSLSVLHQRLIGRKTDTKEQVVLRMKNALIEIHEYHYYDYIVINDTLEEAVSSIEAIIRSSQLKCDLMGSKVVKLLEEKIDNTFG